MDLFNVLTVKDTLKLIDDNFNHKLDGELITLPDAVGRILNHDIIAKENVPDFRRSTVDGYAVYSKTLWYA